MARRFHRPFVRGARRETSWLDIEPVNLTAADGPQSAITHVMTAAELAKRPFTVIRTHYHLMLQSDQGAASENYHLAIGACVVSSQAVAIGVAAVPTPAIDAASDLWFLHGWLSGRFSFFSGSSFNEGSYFEKDFESKAMRKVNDDEEIIFVIDVPAISAGVIFQIMGRVLIKEH